MNKNDEYVKVRSIIQATIIDLATIAYTYNGMPLREAQDKAVELSKGSRLITAIDEGHKEGRL